MYCQKCGERNEDNNHKCVKCGHLLHSSLPQNASQGDILGGLIPRNSKAVIAYYLGVFSLVFWIFCGLPAIIFGILGLKYAKINPQAKGQAHAWTGIILGTLTSLVTIFLIFLIFS